MWVGGGEVLWDGRFLRIMLLMNKREKKNCYTFDSHRRDGFCVKKVTWLLAVSRYTVFKTDESINFNELVRFNEKGRTSTNSWLKYATYRYIITCR
jgi:hypothetical protein